jgi:hypothetical protein
LTTAARERTRIPDMMCKENGLTVATYKQFKKKD